MIRPFSFKNLIRLPFYFLAVLLVASCSSDDSEDIVQDDFLTAIINSSAFEAVNGPGDISVRISGSEDSVFPRTFILQGFDEAINIMGIFVSNYEGPGTYDLSFDPSQEIGEIDRFAQFALSGTAFRSTYGEAGTGSITITEENEMGVSGTFEFVGVEFTEEGNGDTITVTNGRFRAFFDEDDSQEGDQ